MADGNGGNNGTRKVEARFFPIDDIEKVGGTIVGQVVFTQWISPEGHKSVHVMGPGDPVQLLGLIEFGKAQANHIIVSGGLATEEESRIVAAPPGLRVHRNEG